VSAVTSASASRSASSSLPFTPFHFGPGLLGKGLAARWFSWSAFVASNVVIDLESLYYLARHAYPVHRQLHTFVGAALAGLATMVVLLAARRVLAGARRWFEARSPGVRAEGSSTGIVVGAMAGALTHPLFDGLMHRDIEPFQPWTAANPLEGAIDLSALHLGCVIAGLAGVGLLIVRRLRR
jgi:hypothetical protein